MQGASGRALRSDAALDFGGWSSGDFARDMRLRAQPHAWPRTCIAFHTVRHSEICDGTRRERTVAHASHTTIHNA